MIAKAGTQADPCGCFSWFRDVADAVGMSRDYIASSGHTLGRHGERRVRSKEQGARSAAQNGRHRIDSRRSCETAHSA